MTPQTATLQALVDRTVEALQRSPVDEPIATFPEFGLELHPVRWTDVDDDALISALAAWRAQWMAVYPTQFTVTHEGTRAWIRDRLLGTPDRLMFLVRTAGDRRAVGHLGFDDLYARGDQSGEAGGNVISLSNVVVGDREAMPPGAMFAVETAMLRWAFEVWPIPAVHAPIFLDNERSVALQEKLGFVRYRDTPMRRHDLPDGTVAYRPVEPGDDAPADRVWGRFLCRRPA